MVRNRGRIGKNLFGKSWKFLLGESWKNLPFPGFSQLLPLPYSDRQNLPADRIFQWAKAAPGEKVDMERIVKRPYGHENGPRNAEKVRRAKSHGQKKSPAQAIYRAKKREKKKPPEKSDG